MDILPLLDELGMLAHNALPYAHDCEAVGGTLTCSSEGIDVRFWPIAEVPVWHSDHLRQAQAAYTCWLARHDMIG